VSCASRVRVTGAGSAIVNGIYQVQQASIIPSSFAKVCNQSRWDPRDMWQRLNNDRPWWESENGSYIYLNHGDGKWWMDSGETGLGLYIARSLLSDDTTPPLPPLEGWASMGDGELPLPSLTIHLTS